MDSLPVTWLHSQSAADTGQRVAGWMRPYEVPRWPESDKGLSKYFCGISKYVAMPTWTAFYEARHAHSQSR